MNERVKRLFIIIVGGVILTSACSKSSRENVLLDVTVRVDLQEDLGQRLGSLLEARDQDGQVLLGAGFDDAHSTYLRDNSRMLVFYYKDDSDNVTLTPIAKPFGPEHNGVRLFVDGSDLIAVHRVHNPVRMQRLTPNNEWTPYEPSWAESSERFGGVQPLGDQRLVFFANRIEHNGRTIYESDSSGMYYYVDGSFIIFEYETSRLLIREWDPGSGSSIDVLDGPIWEIEGNPFVFGTYRDQIVFATNVGNVYAYQNGQLRHVRKNTNTSWQAYTMLHVYNDLVIGHYPSGSLFVYNDEGLTEFDPPIPIPEDASPDAREAQTGAIYCGDLYVGVWPWGELWRYDVDTSAWEFVDRVFHTPPVRRDRTAPYIEEMEDKWDAVNYWGQRITSLVNYRESLYIGTMNKQGKPFNPEKHGFLDADTVSQYGRVFQLKGSAQLATPFAWKEETELRFVCDETHLRIYQDGEPLSQTAHAGIGHEERAVDEIRAGAGIYGDFSGRVEIVKQ